MNPRDPSEESLPDERQGEHVRDAVFQRVGSRSGLGPLSQPPPERVIARMGPPFSERFDRDIDAIESPNAGIPAGAGGGGSTIEHPFQIQDVSVGMTPTINIRYGTVMDIEPTDIATDIALSVGTSYFYLKNEVDIDGLFVGSELIVDAAPQPPDEDYFGYITLGNAIVAGTAILTINQAATHSLRMAVCGRSVEAGTALLEVGTYEFWGF